MLIRQGSLAVLVAGLSGALFAADFDVVILNGRVMDPETNFDAVRNVGIRDGMIATITKTSSGAGKPSMHLAML